MLKNRVLYAVCLLAALVMVMWSWVWIAPLFLLIALLLPLLSWALTGGLVRKIRFDTVVPASVNRGEELNLVFADRSKSVIPDYMVRVEVEEYNGEISEWVAELDCGEKRAVKLETEHCGAVRCRVTDAYALDYLGLFRFRLFPPNDTVTVVMPAAVQPVPMPVLSQINHSSYRPKYGGGFSEIHDMREYRPGDSMRDIHWKLSAKTDRLIVREAQVPDRGTVLLTIDLQPPCDEFDSVLGQLLWISSWLSNNDTEHEVRWISPATREVESYTVSCKEDVSAMMRVLLSERVTDTLPSICNIHFTNIDWHYHVGEQQ